MFGSSGASNFYRLVEKATSQLLLEPDWDSTIQICDCIRQGDVQPKPALQTLKKKIQNDNPHVCMYALQVLESCVKNCGAVIHVEVATKEFMEFMKDLVKKRPDPVKGKILELIQVWSHAFRNEPSYKIVIDTFHLMKMEGHAFPALKEADAMFKAEKAPEWKDGECCHRCRVGFSTFQRKHHCRNCGNIFCSKCSSKTSIIPKFGLEREVRVCDSCYDNINGPDKKPEESLPKEYIDSSLAQQTQTPPSKAEVEAQEEEELQLALALSKSEAEAKEKERNRMRSNYSSTKNTNEPVYAQPTKVVAPALDTSDMDPELARYLNRNYWEQKQDDVKTATTQPSAPTDSTADTKPAARNNEKVEEQYQNGETSNSDQEEFLNALRSSIEIFVNRMKSNSARGRSIATDSSVQTLFMTINAMHPQLIKYLSELEDSRTHYETLQDKLAQLKDAREALDALREEHREKRRREQEELERQRQIQMAHKLDILRQKKQEYLEYQRQLALQRMQEQEREMQMRFEQQKQLQQMRAMQYGYQMYPQQPATFSPGGSAEGSPLHQPHPAGVPPGSVQPASMPPGGMPPNSLPQGPYSQPPVGMIGAPGAPGIQPGTQIPQGGIPGQPGYNQPGYPNQVPGSYQVQPPAGYQPASYPAGPGQYQSAPGQPPNTQAQGLGQPAPGQPPQGDYQSFNMQSMANSLPNQGPVSVPSQAGNPAPPSLPGQQYMPPGPNQAQYLPPGPQQVQGGLPQGAPPPQGVPPHAQGAPLPHESVEQQLISFD